MQDGTVRSLGDGNGYNIVDYVSPKIDGDLTLVYVIELDRESEKKYQFDVAQRSFSSSSF